jgi:hypothetical protein
MLERVYGAVAWQWVFMIQYASKMKAVIGARGVKIGLLCLFVQMQMDKKRCHCW